MRYLGALIGCLLFASASMTAQDWALVDDLLQRGTVKLTYDGEGTCTGPIIDKARKYILAAGHCGPEPQKGIFVDGAAASVIYKEVEQDLLVLFAPNLDDKKVQLALADGDVKAGAAVASGGYGYGFWNFRIAHVANPKATVPGLVGPFVVIDAPYVPGQSGGPVVNVKGEIVGVVQFTSDRIGIGRGAEYIRDKVGRFFGKEAAKP